VSGGHGDLRYYPKKCGEDSLNYAKKQESDGNAVKTVSLVPPDKAWKWLGGRRRPSDGCWPGQKKTQKVNKIH
jgi:hypothetical protein